MMKTAMKRLITGERGSLMIMALLLLVVGAFITAPLLSYMVGGLTAGRVFETKAAELYAADAGVEDAVWKLQNDLTFRRSCNTTHPHKVLPVITVNGKSVATNVTWVNSRTYRVVSTATGDSTGGTTVESYIEIIPGSELPIFGGALASKSDISLRKDSAVHGDIYYCGSFPEPPNFTHNGTVRGCGAFPTRAEDLAFAEMFRNQARLGGTTNGTMNIPNRAVVNLGPRLINGDLNIGQDAVINLTGTVYVTGSIRAGHEFELRGSGAGALVAEGSIDIHKLSGLGHAGDFIIMSLNGNIEFWKEGTINALVYAPNGTAEFRKEATVVGGVVAENIEARKEGSFTFVPKTSWDFPGELPGGLTIKTYSVDPF